MDALAGDFEAPKPMIRVFLMQLASGVPVEWTERPPAEWNNVVKVLTRAVTRKTAPLTFAKAAGILLGRLSDLEGMTKKERFRTAQSLLGTHGRTGGGMTAEASDDRLAAILCMRGQPHEGRVIRGQNSC